MITKKNYIQALKKLSNYQKKRIVKNIARRYCLLEFKIINGDNLYCVKLTNKITIGVGQYLLDSKEATKILLELGFEIEHNF